MEKYLFSENERLNAIIDELEAQIQELNDDVIWWTNRFNALERENKQLKEEKKKAIEYIKEDIEGNYFKRYDDEIYKMCDDLLEILGDKENE